MHVVHISSVNKYLLFQDVKSEFISWNKKNNHVISKCYVYYTLVDL